MRFSVSFRRAKQIATARLKEGFLFISNHTLLFACPYPVCSFRSNCIHPCIASLDFITDNEAFQSVNHPVQANDERAFVSDLTDSIQYVSKEIFYQKNSRNKQRGMCYKTEMNLNVIYSTVRLSQDRLTFKAPNLYSNIKLFLWFLPVIIV